MRVLFATDGSDEARAGPALVSRFPFPEPTARVLTVQGAGQTETLSLDDLLEEAGPLLASGWKVEPRVVEGDSVAESILREAQDFEAGLIVVGSLGRGRIERFVLGSVADRVARYAPCSVLIARTSPVEGAAPPRIVLAFDGSQAAWECVHWLAGLRLPAGSCIRVVTVLRLLTLFRMDVIETSSPFWAEERTAAEQELSRVDEALAGSRAEVSTRLEESGDPAAQVGQSAADLDADLIVVGNRGRSQAGQLLLGSVADSVIHYGPCSVLVVRGARES